MIFLRPELIKNLIHAEILYKSLSVWSSEMTGIGAPFELNKIFGYNFEFEDPNINFNSVVARIDDFKEIIRNDKFENLLGDDFLDYYYVNSVYNTIQGTYTSSNVIRFEAFYLAFGQYPDSDLVPVWAYVTTYLNKIQKEYEFLTDLADKNSQDVIDKKLSLIITAFMIYGLSTILLYLGLYLPFLKKERLKFHKMLAISKIIPMKSSNR